MKKYFALLFLFYFYYFGPIMAQTTHYLSDGKVIFEQNDQLLDITNGDSLRILKDVILIKYSENLADSVISNIENSNQILRKHTFQTGWISYYIPDTARIINLATTLLTQIGSSTFSFNYPLEYFSSSPIVPDDPEYQNQWYLSDIQVPEAWEITTGDPNIKVSVLDKGTDWNNPDIGPDNGLGWDFINNNGNTFPSSWENWHGNMITSVIAAKTNNSIGTSGIAGGWNSPQVKIAMCKVGDLIPNSEACAAAIEWSLQRGIRLFNFSFGWSQDPGVCSCLTNQLLSDEIDLAYDIYGATMFASAGNFDVYNIMSWPACDSKVIGVGATDKSGYRWDEWGCPAGSTWGVYTDISAPGLEIIYPIVPGQYPPPPDDYAETGGTSCATAVAVGVAALMVSVNPCLSNVDIQEILENTADKTGNYNYNWDPTRPGHSQELGYGKINAYQAVLRASESRTEVASNENITFDTPKWFTHNLTLQPNSVLTITSTVKFNQGCKIIVMPGAQLIVNGGTLTTSCPGFWDGIEVQGNRNLAQQPISNQGYVHIYNNGNRICQPWYLFRERRTYHCYRCILYQ